MTKEELIQYESLSKGQKDFYHMARTNHPDWNHAKCITFAVVCSIPIIEPEPPNSVFKEILKKAQEFISEKFPRIYEQVKDGFQKAIQWIQNAVDITIKRIIEIFD